MERAVRLLRTGPAWFLCGVALAGGTAVAAAKIDGSDVANNTLTGKDVKNKSIAKKDLKASAAGTEGPRGPEGPQGPPGPPGAANLIVRSGPAVTVEAGDFDAAKASCNPGEVATGGGFLAGNVISLEAAGDYPSEIGEVLAADVGSTPTAWTSEAENTGASESDMEPYVVCASP